VREMRMIRQGEAEGDLAGARQKVEDGRLNVRRTMQKLERLGKRRARGALTGCG